MNDEEARRQYVLAAAQALGLELGAEQTSRVVAAFTRNAEVAALVMELDLSDDVEPAAVYRP